MRSLVVLFVGLLALSVALPVSASVPAAGTRAFDDWFYDTVPLLTARPPRDTLAAWHSRARLGARRAREADPLRATWQVDTASTRFRLDMPPQLPAGIGIGDPTAVTVADLDGDGWPDVISTTNWPDSVVVNFDPGAPVPGPRMTLVIPGHAFGLAVGDLDGDGRPDLVVSTWDLGTLVVLRGLGGRTFAPAVAYDAGPGARGLALADLDGDGDLDVAVACADDSTVRVMLNRGDGAFDPGAVLAVGRGPALVIALDVNGDGRPDLVSMDQDAGTLSCLVGLGGGAFAARATSGLPTGPRGIAAGDLDGDGHQDIAVSGSPSSVAMLGDGAGAFTPGATLSTLASPYSGGVAVADLDGDGHLDVALGEDATMGVGAFAMFGVVRVQHGLGGGAFESGPSYRTVARLQTLAIADVDRDGQLDVLAAGAGGGYVDPRSYVTMLRQRPDHRLRSLIENPVPPIPFAPAYAGVHPLYALRLGGPVDDLVGAASGHVLLMANRGWRGFAPPVEVGIGSIAAVRDLDGDGLDDVVLENGGTLSVLRGSPGHTLAPGAWTLSDFAFVALGNFDGDALPDLVVRDGSGMLYRARGAGGATFAAPSATGATIPIDPLYALAHRVANAADLDSDGIDELVLFRERDMSIPDGDPTSSPDTLDVFHSSLGGSLTRIASYLVPWPAGVRFDLSVPGRVLPGDFDGDGRPDLIAVRTVDYGNGYGGYYDVFMNRAGGALQLTEYDYAGREASDAAVVDLDGDLRDDVVFSAIYSDDTGYLAWLQSRGDGTFDRGRRNDLGDYLTAVAVGRFDEDVRPDVAVVDARNRVMNVTFNATPWPFYVTAVLASVISADVDAGVARITWSVTGGAGAQAVVQRSADAVAWTERARLIPDGEGRVRYEDAGVAPGARYAYRLAVTSGGLTTTTAVTWLAVPATAPLALAGARPNPVAGDLTVAFSLDRRTTGTLALFDVAGRRVATSDLAALDAGEHRVRLASAGALRPGLYLIRLTTPERALTARAIVVR